MGNYDLIETTCEWCRCSEGHDLRPELLQTYDLGRTMGNWTLDDDELRGEPGTWGEPVDLPLTGMLSVYTFCRECPALLQPETWNVLQAWVEWEIDLEANRVVAVRRISETTAAWIERERAEGAIGPMPLAEALSECTARRGL